MRVQRPLRILLYTTYPFLGISLLLFMGMLFGAAFVTSFTVENRSGALAVVTPVGRRGSVARPEPLPVMMFSFFPAPAFRNGGYRLGPGESVKIAYDMDDVRLSEIVVWADGGGPMQLVVPAATTRAGGSLNSRFVIDDVAGLEPASADAVAAAHGAGLRWAGVAVMDLLLFGPWVAYGVIVWLLRRAEKRETSRAVL
jgi:hypothetical protein